MFSVCVMHVSGVGFKACAIKEAHISKEQCFNRESALSPIDLWHYRRNIRGFLLRSQIIL